MLHVHEPPMMDAALPLQRGRVRPGALNKQRHRSVVVATTILVAMLLVLGFLVVHRHGLGDPAGEDGTFANDCCGTVDLSRGTMLLNGRQTMRYVVGRDADGPYILPRFYVGVVPFEGLDVDGTRSVRRLRLDRLPGPARITLYEGLKPYVFTRQAPRTRAR